MDDLFSHHLEDSYIINSTVEHRKKYAQFFTPYKIAQFMAAWVLGGDRQVSTILDPAVGLGVFIRAIREQLRSPLTASQVRIKGYDIDPQILAIAQQELTKLDYSNNIKLSIELLELDYLFHDWDCSYDGIICNPPYLRFQDFLTRDFALQEMSDRLNIKLSGFTNIYALFLLKSIHQLKENGRCGYIIPSEFLNSDYGKTVKKYLLEHKSLRYILIFNFKKNVFDRALTTASIFLFSHDDQPSTLEFINISSLKDLDHQLQKIYIYPKQLSNNQIISYQTAELDTNIKWRGYYQVVHAHKYQNLVDFSTYAKVSRGIATGANDYFLFTSEKAQHFNIDESFLLSVISKSIQVSSNFFTQQDFLNLATNNKPVFLFNADGLDTGSLDADSLDIGSLDADNLDADSLENSPVKAYILRGESLGIDKKYLTSHRKPWYAIEHRLPPPIWVSVFSRGGLRFIRNEAGVRNLTTFHCVYLNTLAQEKIDLLFAYLLTDVAKDIFADQQREYGGGLEKFEPNDLNHGQVINLDCISELEISEIMKCYSEYRKSCLNSQEDTDLLDRLNDIFVGILS